MFNKVVKIPVNNKNIVFNIKYAAKQDISKLVDNAENTEKLIDSLKTIVDSQFNVRVVSSYEKKAEESIMRTFETIGVTRGQVLGVGVRISSEDVSEVKKESK